mgnify:FL=1
MNDNQKAASILRQYAGELYQGHTIGGEWDGEHIKAEHDELIALADRLALAQGGEAANSAGLLPCPYCGDDEASVAVMQEGASGDDYSFSAEAQCVCGATGPEAYASCQSDAALGAINAWNYRAIPSANRVAELEAQLAESREREGRMREALAYIVDRHEQDRDGGFLDANEYSRAVAALAADQEKK